MSSARSKRARTSSHTDNAGTSRVLSPTEVAEKRTAMLDSKKFILERWMEWEAVPELDKFRGTINNLHWVQFVGKPIAPNLRVVREFYFALPEADFENSLVRIKNKTISFSDEAVNAVFGTPNTPLEADSYAQLSQNSDSHWFMVEHVLTQGQGAYHPEGKRTLRAPCLSREAKVWNTFIQNRVFPSSNNTDLSSEHQLFLFCVLAHQPLNVGRVINARLKEVGDSILNFTLADHAHLPFPSLITALCQRAGVPISGARGDVGTKMSRAFWTKCHGAPGTDDEMSSISFYNRHWSRRDNPSWQPPPPMPLFVPPQPQQTQGSHQQYARNDTFFKDARWIAHQQDLRSYLVDMENRQNQYNYQLMSHVFSRMQVTNNDPLPMPYQWPPPPPSSPVPFQPGHDSGGEEDEQ